MRQPDLDVLEPVRQAREPHCADRAGARLDLSGGRVDVMLGRGNTGTVYPWFGKDIRDAVPLTVENYGLLRRLWREPVDGSATKRWNFSGVASQNIFVTDQGR